MSHWHQKSFRCVSIDGGVVVYSSLRKEYYRLKYTIGTSWAIPRALEAKQLGVCERNAALRCVIYYLASTTVTDLYYALKGGVRKPGYLRFLLLREPENQWSCQLLLFNLVRNSLCNSFTVFWFPSEVSFSRPSELDKII